jgi:hypothetical protein
MVAVTIQSDGTDVAGALARAYPRCRYKTDIRLPSEKRQGVFSSGDVGGADNAVVVLGMDAAGKLATSTSSTKYMRRTVVTLYRPKRREGRVW